jgi:hypothetical protein
MIKIKPLFFFQKVGMKYMSVYAEMNKYITWQQSHSCTARSDVASQFVFGCCYRSSVCCFYDYSLTRCSQLFYKNIFCCLMGDLSS